MKLVSLLVVAACFSMVLGYEQCVTLDGDTVWYCTFSCCPDSLVNAYCCNNYWYAWTAGSLVFLICLGIFAGCGGYRYRRHYIVQQTYTPVTHGATVVTTAHTSAYQPQPTYQSTAPPAYK